jgi:hypothetical protein
LTSATGHSRHQFRRKGSLSPETGPHGLRSHANGQAVAYTYFRPDENEARQANVLTRDLARRIAANIAKLPDGRGGRE